MHKGKIPRNIENFKFTTLTGWQEQRSLQLLLKICTGESYISYLILICPFQFLLKYIVFAT